MSQPSHRALRTAVAIGASVATLVACSAEQTRPGEPAGTGVHGGADGGIDPLIDGADAQRGVDTIELACAAADHAGEAALRPFESLTARVVDLAGVAASGISAQACGVNLCLYGTTEEDGTVSILQSQSLDRPAFKYGLGRDFIKVALPLPADARLELGEQRTARLPPASEGARWSIGGQTTSGDVTLTLAADTRELDFDPFDFDSEQLRLFRAVGIPPDQAPDAVDASLGLELLYGMTPVDTELCPPARLEVPNEPGWPAGAAVEVFLHGVDVAERWAPYGGWAKVSDAAVSPDGAKIITADGGGLPVLGLVGMRRR